MISYEYPLNERVRTLLRLEDLFERALYFSGRADSTEHHVALISLFEILEVAGRADLKSDLLQELERQKHALESLRDNPQISQEALDQVLKDIDITSRGLLDMAGKIGQHLRDNEWLMSIKQRTSIPGGVCEFDLPSYHYWLHQDAEQRRQNLNEWLGPLLPIRDGLAIVLRLLRDSGKTAKYVAYQGVYQQMLAGRMAQMIQLKLAVDLPCVPEISANKYALNIRFITAGMLQRPKLFEHDVEFELTFCNL
ncbi:MAG: cell division protein ZapD [Betaproteobacteria bacterium]|nr:cell division protein ZapD [Betaproteobacteria bacterium]